MGIQSQPIRRLSLSAVSWVLGLLDSVLALPSTAALGLWFRKPHSSKPALPLPSVSTPAHTAVHASATAEAHSAVSVFVLGSSSGCLPIASSCACPSFPGTWTYWLPAVHPDFLSLASLTHPAPFCPMIWGLSLFCV